MKSEHPKGNGKKRERLTLAAHGKEQFLSHEPTGGSTLIGQSLAVLSNALKESTDSNPFEIGITSELLKHNAENAQYIEEKLLEAVSCPHAIKKWAFERMSQLALPYEMKNRLKPRDIEENADGGYSQAAGSSGGFSADLKFLPKSAGYAGRYVPSRRGNGISFRVHGELRACGNEDN